jgi:hypothetical protein
MVMLIKKNCQVNNDCEFYLAYLTKVFFMKTASEFQEMIQDYCKVIKDKNEEILKFMIVPERNNIRSLLEVLKEFDITNDIDLNNAVVDLYNLTSVTSDKIDEEITSSATKAKRFQEEIIDKVCQIAISVLESSMVDDQTTTRRNKRSVDQILLQVTDQNQAGEEKSKNPEKKLRSKAPELGSVGADSPLRQQEQMQEFMSFFNLSSDDLNKPLSQSPETMIKILNKTKEAMKPTKSPNPTQGKSGQHQGQQISNPN